ncbi:STAS domain-containing protein [Longibacter sp.]|jgi:anti-anti-sigma regulatory factor|uniref:STAS domain-containing protein n=1 Tax=Longibacter sp. TaxID=2045415 RepID=UPI003EB9538F
MHHTRDGNELTVEVNRDLNLLTGRYIARLADSSDRVVIDLRHSRIADTEGIAHLHRLQLKGKEVTLRNPSDMVLEILRVLDLTGLFEIHTDATV